jgi:transformation/transcription domain-associated protein
MRDPDDVIKEKKKSSASSKFVTQYVSVMFDLLVVFTKATLIDFSFLEHFYKNTLSSTRIATFHKFEIIRYFIALFRNAKVMQDVKVSALRLLIVPMFTRSLLSGETNMVDKETLRSIMKDLLMGETAECPYSESLRIELLHLSTVLIRFVGRDMMDHRKELIKFAWNHLKSDDNSSKQWAYVNVCQFIQVYETPPKIILQVFVALLRTYQSESASLGRKALCILTPALPKRLQPRDLVKAIKWTKKIVYVFLSLSLPLSL